MNLRVSTGGQPHSPSLSRTLRGRWACVFLTISVRVKQPEGDGSGSGSHASHCACGLRAACYVPPRASARPADRPPVSGTLYRVYSLRHYNLQVDSILQSSVLSWKMIANLL